MNLIYTPASMTYTPDRFEDPETGKSYEVVQDVAAEDPRNWNSPEFVCIYVYARPRQSSVPEAPENIAAQAFRRFVDIFNDEKALELTRRYLAIFWPERPYSVAIQTLRGYSQGDWCDAFVAVAPGYGEPEDHLSTFRMWAYGDVWWVTAEDGDPLGGIYADTPEEAVKQYIKEQPAAPAENTPAQDVNPLGSGYLVQWEIDDTDDSKSPAEAAARVWRQIFGRLEANPEDACVFTVVDNSTGEKTQIDLSEEDFDALLDS